MKLFPNFKTKGMALFSFRWEKTISFSFRASKKRGISLGSCWPSPSNTTILLAPFFKAWSQPVFRAAPLPRFTECFNTVTPSWLAVSKVLSVEPSSTMIMLGIYFLVSIITRLIFFSSLCTGITPKSAIFMGFS